MIAEIQSHNHTHILMPVTQIIKREAEVNSPNIRMFKVGFERVTLADDQKLLRRRAPTRALKQVADMLLIAALPHDAQTR